ncbi:hypothetical protein E2C01_050756 [Portunus trituberculatus]|uniref:Uncharacterized protein n=1 Tax=Portunus trituberculatus TaxID=210409 RepID=A0A5B7GGZ4_PORTR|nr:hypothetical protein [Portunus trituberculatus]
MLDCLTAANFDPLLHKLQWSYQLAAGSPPNMPIFSGWMDCYSHLRQIRGLKRGSSMLWRPFTGPTMMMGDNSNAHDMGENSKLMIRRLVQDNQTMNYRTKGQG